MRLSYSNTTDFKNCRRKFKYKHIDRIIPKERPLYFNMGGAFHELLKIYYTRGKDLAFMYESVKKYELPNKDEKLLFEVFDRYVERYHPEPFEPYLIERDFEISIPGSDLNFYGIADGVVILDGNYWLIEHKFKKQITSLFKKSLIIDNQSISYIYALEKLHNIKIQGVIYNIILKDLPNKPLELKKGGLSKDKSQKTTYDLYLKKVLSEGYNELEYADILNHLKNNPREYFYREYLTFSNTDFKEWGDDLSQLAIDIECTMDDNSWYKNTSQCVNFGTCEYFDICTAIYPEEIIKTSYKKRGK